MSLDERCERLAASGYGCVAGYLRKLADDPAYAVVRAVAEGHDNVITFVRLKQESAERLREAVAQGQSTRS